MFKGIAHTLPVSLNISTTVNEETIGRQIVTRAIVSPGKCLFFFRDLVGLSEEVRLDFRQLTEPSVCLRKNEAGDTELHLVYGTASNHAEPEPAGRVLTLKQIAIDLRTGAVPPTLEQIQRVIEDTFLGGDHSHILLELRDDAEERGIRVYYAPPFDVPAAAAGISLGDLEAEISDEFPESVNRGQLCLTTACVDEGTNVQEDVLRVSLRTRTSNGTLGANAENLRVTKKDGVLVVSVDYAASSAELECGISLHALRQVVLERLPNILPDLAVVTPDFLNGAITITNGRTATETK